MRSFVKIYGPPLLKAIRALEKISVDMPEVCIMDTTIAFGGPEFNTNTGVMEYFSQIGVAKISEERCNKIISKSGMILGEYDFFFEWFKNPTQSDINNLLAKIDEALSPLGVKYTITTK